MAWRIGVDSAGTFTDICLFEEKSGGIAFWKVSSTAADPSLGVAERLGKALAQIGVNASDVSYFGHGTTVATNALIQHRGAPTGLITSDGFRDLLEIGRQKRPVLYDLQADKPPVLVERRLRLEVPERLRYDGRVETALAEAAVHSAVRVLRDAGVKAVAVCFLYSFLDPAHEAAACRIVAEEFPETFVCASHEVAPEFREYERLSTTVVNSSIRSRTAGCIFRVHSNHFFAALCELIGRLELARGPRCATMRSRAAHAAELVPELRAALAARSAHEWEAIFGERVPCAAVR